MSGAQQQTRAIAARSTDLRFTISEEMTLTSVADVFVKSGLFKDVRDQAQAMVKVLAGREMGLEPVEAMMSLYVVSGRVGIYAEALAAKVKAAPDMNYRVLEHTDQICSIQFKELVNGAWEECGPPSTFTADDAKRAGTQNMAKFGRNMLFARAMSNGFKWYCPHLKVPGMLTAEEIEDIPADDAPSPGAAALNEALEVFDTPTQPQAVEQAPDPTPAQEDGAGTSTTPPGPEPEGSDRPTLDAYRRLCAGYKAHLGEDAYHALLTPFSSDDSGKSNTVPPEAWERALVALHAACSTGAPEDAPFPKRETWAEALAMKKGDLAEGIEGLEIALHGDAWKTLRQPKAEAYLGDNWAVPKEALVTPLRVYHARLSDLAWQSQEAKQDADDLFGVEGGGA